MASDLTFSGERFLPDCEGEIAYEHWHRYAFARQFAGGKRVLDAACGEGYGSALLAAVASSVVGVDIDGSTVAHAQKTYGDGERLRFAEGSCTNLPLPDASVDLVVSFETIEHLPAADQPRMLAEFARVLRPDGLLLISSPNKRLYSDETKYVNEFHLHELYRGDLADLLSSSFAAQRWYHQRVASWSTIWAEPADGAANSAAAVETWLGDANDIEPYATADGVYFIVLAARAESSLPARTISGSLFTDRGNVEQKRAAHNANEALRLDALLKERDSTLDRQTGHVQHLERLVAEREGIIADMDRRLLELNAAREFRETLIQERDTAIAGLQGREASLVARTETLETRTATLEARAIALEADLDRLRRELDEATHTHETESDELRRVIAYRQSTRWWLTLPWVRARQWLQER